MARPEHRQRAPCGRGDLAPPASAPTVQPQSPSPMQIPARAPRPGGHTHRQCAITASHPATNIAASGTQGGPFSPSSFRYTLSRLLSGTGADTRRARTRRSARRP
jgi:hypothetical protein